MSHDVHAAPATLAPATPLGSNAGSPPGPGPRLMGAHTLIGNEVHNPAGEDLGDVKEIMLDTQTGGISYVVLSFGGFVGMGEKLFAVPWTALELDTANKRFVLDVSMARLDGAPGFDKDRWPDAADESWKLGAHPWPEGTPQQPAAARS